MNVQLRQIEAFLALVDAGTFSEAARRFGLSQPAFSAMIARMEEEIGVRLFDRTSRSVSLSKEGRIFLPKARNLERNWTEVFDQMADLAEARAGRVTVAALPSLAAGLLSDVAVSFARSHPGVRLDLRDVLHEEVVALVRSGRADFGLSVAPAEDSGIGFQPFLEDAFVAILPRDHALCALPRLTWEDLCAHPLIMMSKATSVRRLIDATLAAAGRETRFLLEVNHLATIAGLVTSGYGVSALPALCLPVVLRPDLRWRPLVAPQAWRTLGLLRLPQAPSIATAALLEELSKVRSRDDFEAFDGGIRFLSPRDGSGGLP